MTTVIFVILANKYGTTYLPQILPSIMVASLVAIPDTSSLDNLQATFLATPKNDEVLKLSLVF